MASLASDMNNVQFTGAANPDDALHVTFYTKSIQNDFESEKQGRPIFYEIMMVRIMTPGDQLNIIDRPVREDHKYRFPRQWATFQASQNHEQLVGTPVEEWPAVTRAQADELRGLKFYTVEQIANASDLQIQKLGMNANMMKQKAKAYLSTSQDTALQTQQAAELVRKEQQINELTNTVNKLIEKVETLAVAPEPERVKRKYTKRVKEETPETT